MAPVVKQRIYALLKYHSTQPLGGGRHECIVCMTPYPCMTIKIAKGHVVWNFELERFEEKREANERI